MSNDPNELVKALGTLGTRYLEEYSRGLRRYTEVLNDMAARPAGDTDSVQQGLELQQRHTRFVLEESPRILQRLAEAGVSYYAALANTGMQFMNGYVDQVLKADAECADGAGPARGARSPLLFHGERGHQASNAFMVSNSHDQAIDVTFAIGELASSDGSVHFEPEARFTPSHCKVPPRGQQVVQCSLSLSADFAAGQAHHGHIQVVGYPEMAMPIRVEVEEAAAGANDPQPAKPKQKTSARKASAVKRKPAAKR